MAQGRSTKIISMIKWIRTSSLSMKNSLSLSVDTILPCQVQRERKREFFIDNLLVRIRLMLIESFHVRWCARSCTSSQTLRAAPSRHRQPLQGLITCCFPLRARDMLSLQAPSRRRLPPASTQRCLRERARQRDGYRKMLCWHRLSAQRPRDAGSP